MTDRDIRILQTDISGPQVRRHQNTRDMLTKKTSIGSAYFTSRNSYRNRSEAPTSTMIADSMITFKPVLTQNSATFTTEIKFDRLHDVALLITLPSFIVKKAYTANYRICWPTCVGRYLIEKVVVKDIEGIVLSSLNSDVLTLYDVFFNPKTDAWNQRIGNVEELTEWNDKLPEYDLCINIPFFFTMARDMGLPFDRKNSDKISISFTLRPFEELLRMQCKNKAGVFVDIPLNTDILKRSNPSKEVGLVAFISSEDTDYHKPLQKINTISIDYTEIRHIGEQKIASTDGTTIEIPLNEDVICEALFVTVKLKNRQGMNDFGIFPKSDRPLLETFQFFLGLTPYIQTISNQSIHSLIRDTHFSEASNDPEIYCIPLTKNPGNLDALNTGINLNYHKAKLVLGFGNGKYVYAKESPTEQELQYTLDQDYQEGGYDNKEKPLELVVNVYGLVQLNVTYRYNENSEEYFISLEESSKNAVQPRDSRDYQEEEYRQRSMTPPHSNLLNHTMASIPPPMNTNGMQGSASTGAHLQARPGNAHLSIPTPVHFSPKQQTPPVLPQPNTTAPPLPSHHPHIL